MGVIPNKPLENKLRILFVGAHPDDADIEFGGTAIKYLNLGHTVTYLALTNGDAGHQELGGKPLAERRRKESQAVEQFLGIEYIVLDNHDAELQATIQNRNTLIQIIREKRPNVIITNRPQDYHTDHRNASVLVQDAAYLIAVQNVVPSIPRLDYNPVIVYHQDNFNKPYPFTPNIFVDITDVIDKKMEALSFHESQVYEWLPFIEKYLEDVPKTKDKNIRLRWLKKHWGNPGNVNKFLPLLKTLVPEEKFNSIHYIEVFEACEYGGQLTAENAKELFPFGIFHF
jgi:LmbE family N-acetylglucosaminyl deacetylase